MLTSSIPYRQITAYFEQPTSIAPLVVFRMAFGLLMLFSTVRYMALGWVDTQLIEPILHFSYFGFDWVKPLPGSWMYLVFVMMILSSIGITLGAFYRISALLFFLCFSYVELIDITYYLNHYYFVSLVSFLLIIVPANRYFSWDALKHPLKKTKTAPQWCIGIFKLQIAIVYIYAGLAKINYDWLIQAMPLSIWLPAKNTIPVIGFLFNYEITPFLFSWAGMLFDTFIILGLLYQPTRKFSYLMVIGFHLMTGILFQIGVFPLVMIFAVTIFFSPAFHESILKKLMGLLRIDDQSSAQHELSKTPKPAYLFLLIFFAFQLAFPWRYLLYGGNIFWTEEGYRFSWRVMLMEKAGTATFYVKDGENGREGSVINHQFLNDHQEKQMAMQPDLILQFAHYLEQHFISEGMRDPQVRAEVLVTLNASPAHLLIDPSIDLTEKSDGWARKDWILQPNVSP